jgi:tetratricopeptide (TPR) repeat protein
MRRVVLATTALLALAPATWAREKPPDEKKAPAQSPKQRYEAIVGDYQKAQQAFSEAYQKAKTEAEQSKVFEQKYPKPETFAGRFLDLAREAPDDPSAVDALVWIVQYAQRGKEVDEAVDRLLKDHLQDPKMATVCQSLIYSSSPGAEKLLRGVLEKGTDDQARGTACFALGEFFTQQARIARVIKDDPAMAKRVEEFYGKEAADQIVKKDPAALDREAESLFERAAKQYGAVKYGRSTLADEAKGQLFEIRHLGIGKVAPEIVGENIDGKPLKLSDYKGKVVVLDFFGHW